MYLSPESLDFSVIELSKLNESKGMVFKMKAAMVFVLSTKKYILLCFGFVMKAILIIYIGKKSFVLNTFMFYQ